MTPDRWQQVSALYHAARARQEGERAEFLAAACAGDAALRREVESLLAQPVSAVGFLNEPAVAQAAQPVRDAGTSVLTSRTLGAYEVQGQIGAGAMGEVYRARDAKLGRDVALKVLPRAFTTDPDRLVRFEQEARVLAALNHPHILTVYDTGEFDGRKYLVTEFVDGGTLADWVHSQKRSWRQVVSLMTGVADGLAAAHAAGVLHRDIKPTNILVAKNGYAKLADFGLAKLVQGTEGVDEETSEPTAPRTGLGVVVGTPAYMSPEQAGGKPLDPRSDIFSFAVVLYELLAGRRPFAGATDLELLQRIVSQAPASLPSTVPMALRLAVEKALDKDPADRYQTMRDLVVDLRRVARARADDDEPQANPGQRRTRWLMAAAVAAALAIGAAVGLSVAGSGEPAWRNPLDGATFTRLTDFEGIETDAVISPDGNFVAFVSDRDGPLDVWVLQLGSGQFRNLTNGKANLGAAQMLGFTPDASQVTFTTIRPNLADGTNVGGTSIVPTIGGPVRLFMDDRLSPRWSPDGTRLLFFSLVKNRDVVYTADRDGSNPRELFPVIPDEHNHYVGWSSDGRYVYSARSTQDFQEYDIWRAPSGGGEPERLTHHNGYVVYPAGLDARTLLYVAADENGTGTWLYAMDLDRRERHRLSVGVEQYSSIAVSTPASGRSRRLVATVSNPIGILWSIPITTSVAPESVASVFRIPSASVSSPRFGPNYLLYLSSRELADGVWKFQGETASELWQARDGAVLAAPGVSRDGSQIAVAALKQGRPGLFVISVDGGNPRQLASSVGVREEPTWSPDGKAIAASGYDDRGPGLFIVPADGGPAVRLYDKNCRFPIWSPDGRYILFAEYFLGPYMRLKAITPQGKSFPLPDIRMRVNQATIPRAVSPYRFLPDGKSLVMQDGGWRMQQFFLIDMATGERRQLTDLRHGKPIRGFDVSPDGKSILFDRVQENSDIVLIDLPPQS